VLFPLRKSAFWDIAMRKFVYIDESGDESLQLTLPNVSSFYVVCAVVVNAADAAAAMLAFGEVRQRYFKGREMKSSSIRDGVLRQRILQDLTGVPFSLHMLVGNKKLLTSPGLRYPKSFIKFLHGSLYQQLVKEASPIQIRADKIKNRSFMDEMHAYLDRHNLIGLFDINSFEFVDSSSDVGVQVADFIGGSVRECFERNAQTAMTDPTMQKLRWHMVQLLPFPDSYGRYIAKLPGLGEHDQVIEARAVLQAEEFLRKHNADECADRLVQVTAVRLLSSALARNDEQWVPTAMMMENLNLVATEPLSEQGFRNVIGKLRDEGVLIASRASGGYKLPTGMADLTQFLNRQNSQLAPMIERVRIARDTVRVATDNAVDILSAPEFSNLKAIVAATSYWSEPTDGASSARPLNVLPTDAIALEEILSAATPA
jgi:hypothetical protein